MGFSRAHDAPIALAILAGLLGCGERAERGGRELAAAPVPVELAIAHEEDIDVLYRASGTIRGFTTAVLTSKIAGYVRSIDVRAGDHVEAGQVLAVLEAKESAESVRRARAAVSESVEARTEAENALRAAEAQLRIAQSTYDRMAALFESGAIARQAFDEAQATFDRAQAEEKMAAARLRGSGSRIEQANAAAGEAEANLADSKITAPFSGWVIERKMDPGNLASPGMAVLVIEDRGNPRVEVDVEESRTANVVAGDAATIDIDALGRSVEGSVGEVVPAVDPSSRAFVVKIDLPRSLDGLRPGMFARVAFRVGTERRLVVPVTAVTPRGALDRVFVADDRLRLRIVTLGERQGPWVEVLSGLSPGERVVSVVTPEVRDGARFTEQP